MKKGILFLIFATLLLSLSAQETKRVLFIGNSYTDVNNLPLLVRQVAESTGNRLDYQSNTPGGCTFSQHCTNQSMTYICEGGWDVVVLQEQSQLPSFPQSQVETQCFPYAAQLVDSIYANNPDGEAMFYMTWGRKNGDSYNAQYFPVLGTYEGMDSMLYERYMYMARTNDASVSPVGRVWRYIRNNHPDIELYQSDDSHPSMAGSYAAACTFFTMIYHASPIGVTYTADLDEDVALRIRQAVQDVVYDTLSFWLRQPADTTSTDTTIVDTTTVDTTTVDTTTVGIRMANGSLQCAVYPNPAHHTLTVTLPNASRDAEAYLYDIQGRRVACFRLLKGENGLSVASYPAGIYSLVVVTDEGTATKRIVIK